MSGEDGGHLVVIGGVDVFVNAVAGQLYLKERKRSGGGRRALQRIEAGLPVRV